MIEISLCMIVKNEENTLGHCLSSIGDLVDEIIIVDTGSEDKTKQVAKKYTDKIYDFKWIDDFAAARNEAYAKATKEYTMWLDADDILKEPDREKFKKMKQELSPEVDIIIMPYHISFYENGTVKQMLYRERITKTGKFHWVDALHETLNISPRYKSIFSDVVISHTKEHFSSDRNFNILDKMIKSGNVNPKFLYYYAGELRLRNRLDEAIYYYEQFFAREEVSVFYKTEACINLHFLYCIKKEYNKALKLSLSCLDFSVHYSEFCCQLGSFYKEQLKNLDEAIYWFQLALECPVPKANAVFVSYGYYYYIPNLELGICFELKNNLLESLKYYTKAFTYNENDLVLFNRINILKDQLIQSQNTP